MLRDTRDRRDPIELGSALLKRREHALAVDKPLSLVYDVAPLDVADYSSNLGPIEKYGRPQDIPSTMPCAVE